MIHRRDSDNVIGLDGQSCSIRIGYDNGIRLVSLCAPGSKRSVLGATAPFIFTLSVEGETLDPATVEIESYQAEEIRGSQLASLAFRQRHKGDTIRGRIALREKNGSPMELTVQIAVDWSNGVPALVNISLPFLAALARKPRFYRPGEAPGERGAEQFSAWSFLEFPPAVIYDPSGNGAIGFELPGEFPFQENHNNPLHQALINADLDAAEVQIRPTAELEEIFDIRLHGSTTGRAGVFESWKQSVRRKYDLRRYQLPGTVWCQKTYLQHFTFAYGKEIFDYERNAIDIDRLFSDGERFGGYDAIIYWPLYPRLGLDERTQWELYDELPAGRKTLKTMADACHSRGARFFLPFMPWDVRSFESLDDQAKEIERLVAETGVDGFFLDTMDWIPESFTRLIRDKFPELVFCSEWTPYEPPHIEQLTGSWNQIPERYASIAMKANLARFVFPEHPLNMISRWSVGSQKDTLIKRAAFNGTGMVIWQDVFGRWLPYDNRQKAMVAQLKSALSQYHDDIFGQESIPLVDTEVPGLLANRFASRPDERQVYSLYNSTSASVAGPLLRIPGYDLTRVSLLFGEGVECRASAGNGGTTIEGTINADDVIMICVENPSR